MYIYKLYKYYKNKQKRTAKKKKTVPSNLWPIQVVQNNSLLFV